MYVDNTPHRHNYWPDLFPNPSPPLPYNRRPYVPYAPHTYTNTFESVTTKTTINTPQLQTPKKEDPPTMSTAIGEYRLFVYVVAIEPEKDEKGNYIGAPTVYEQGRQFAKNADQVRLTAAQNLPKSIDISRVRVFVKEF